MLVFTPGELTVSRSAQCEYHRVQHTRWRSPQVHKWGRQELVYKPMLQHLTSELECMPSSREQGGEVHLHYTAATCSRQQISQQTC